MADDWESLADDPAPVVSQWEGEDEEEAVVSNWDDEDKPEPTPQPTANAATANKTSKKDKKSKKDEKKESRVHEPVRELSKAELEQVARDRDARLAASLLGGDVPTNGASTSSETPSEVSDSAKKYVKVEDTNDLLVTTPEATAAAKAATAARGTNIEQLDPLDDAATEKAAHMLAKRFTDLPLNAKNSQRMLRFCRLLITDMSEVMKVEDVSELQRTMTTRYNELMARQRIQQKGGKKAAVASASAGAKKPAAVIKASSGGRNSAFADDMDDGGGDDEDFM